MTIAEVSRLLGISADTLRYYERIGLVPPIKRNQSGNRDYEEKDCNWIKFVKCMRGAGLSIEALIEYTSLFRQGDETAPERKQILLQQRASIVEKMEELQETLDYLDFKIDRYEEVMLPKEQELGKQ